MLVTLSVVMSPNAVAIWNIKTMLMLSKRRIKKIYYV